MEAMVPTWKSGIHRTGSSVCLSGDNHETMAKEGVGGMFFRKRLSFGAGDVGGGRRWWRM